ncbi:MAG: reverse transcriptase domain-containing protein, partial [Patescibacteria group bacterium]
LMNYLSLITTYCLSGRKMAVWSSDSKSILSNTKETLNCKLNKEFDPFCMHIKNRGSVQGAQRVLSSVVKKYKFVARFDVDSYYSSINHKCLLSTLSSFDLDSCIIDIVEDYLSLPDSNKTGIGMTAGGSISPILGALYLLPLDRALRRLTQDKSIFYLRYMDDFIILTKSRWKLKNAIKLIYKICSSLYLKLHTKEKIFIGKTEKGFDFLGFFFHPSYPVVPSKVTFKRCVNNIRRLFEQGYGLPRIRRYLDHWSSYYKKALCNLRLINPFCYIMVLY